MEFKVPWSFLLEIVFHFFALSFSFYEGHNKKNTPWQNLSKIVSLVLEKVAINV